MPCINCSCGCSESLDLGSRVLKKLAANPNAVWTVDGMVEEFGCDRRNLANHLSKLVGYELIERVGRGQYRVARNGGGT